MLNLHGIDPIASTHGPVEIEETRWRRVEPVLAAHPTERIRPSRHRRRPRQGVWLWEGLTFAGHLARLSAGIAPEAPAEESPEAEPGDPAIGSRVDVRV